MTEAECKAEIRKFFMELYPACTVIYSYPGNAARPPAPYVVLDFDAADSSQIDEYVDDGILQQTWYMSMPFSAELVAQSKVVHGGGVKKALLSTVVDDLAQSIRFFQSPYAEDKMRLLNISVTATGNPEQIYNSVSGVERARCSFSVDFVQNTKEYAALHPQDGEYIADHDSAASKELADMQAGYFTEVEIEPQINGSHYAYATDINGTRQYVEFTRVNDVYLLLSVKVTSAGGLDDDFEARIKSLLMEEILSAGTSVRLQKFIRPIMENVSGVDYIEIRGVLSEKPDIEGVADSAMLTGVVPVSINQQPVVTMNGIRVVKA